MYDTQTYGKRNYLDKQIYQQNKIRGHIRAHIIQE